MYVVVLNNLILFPRTDPEEKENKCEEDFEEDLNESESEEGLENKDELTNDQTEA